MGSRSKRGFRYGGHGGNHRKAGPRMPRSPQSRRFVTMSERHQQQDHIDRVRGPVPFSKFMRQQAKPKR